MEEGLLNKRRELLLFFLRDVLPCLQTVMLFRMYQINVCIVALIFCFVLYEAWYTCEHAISVQ